MNFEGTYFIFITLFVSYLGYFNIPQENYIKKNFCFIFMISSFGTLINYLFNIYINNITFLISLLFLKFIYNSLKLVNKKSDKLNQDNVFFLAYKPKNIYMSLKGLFGCPIASSGNQIQKFRVRPYEFLTSTYINRII